MIMALGVMLLILVYLVTVQGAVRMSAGRARLAEQRQEAAEAMAGALTQAIACEAAGGGTSGATVRTPLPAEHPLWRALTGMSPLPGDEMITVTQATPLGARRGRFIVNRQGRRQGAIALDGAEGVALEPKPEPAQGRL